MVRNCYNVLKKIATPDTIGPAECPILYRWTLFPLGFGSNSSSTEHLKTAPDWLPKLLLHHFVPQADERDSHDHPRGFWTLVLKGGYDDMIKCDWCNGTGNIFWDSEHEERRTDGYCMKCSSTGIVLNEVMRAGMIRYRPPEHTHRTRVHQGGCWSLVLMGPKRRDWGFHRDDGSWMPYKEYFEKIGYGMRCV